MSAAPTWIHLSLDVPRDGWPTSLAFWSAATRTTASTPRGETSQFVILQPHTDDAWLTVQAVVEGPRVHLDLDSPGPAAAYERSLGLGARPAPAYDDVEVVRSPGGLLHCHTQAGERRRLARDGADSLLDQVCLDIPAPLWDREVAYWSAVTGRELEQGGEPEFAFLGSPDPEGAIRILLQRLDSTTGEVRAHPDFAVADRPAETTRHLALGAQVVDVRDWWTVLRAPDGLVYCLTDRDPATGRVRR